MHELKIDLPYKTKEGKQILIFRCSYVDDEKIERLSTYAIIRKRSANHGINIWFIYD